MFTSGFSEKPPLKSAIIYGAFETHIKDSYHNPYSITVTSNWTILICILIKSWKTIPRIYQDTEQGEFTKNISTPQLLSKQYKAGLSQSINKPRGNTPLLNAIHARKNLNASVKCEKSIIFSETNTICMPFYEVVFPYQRHSAEQLSSTLWLFFTKYPLSWRQIWVIHRNKWK